MDVAGEVFFPWNNYLKENVLFAKSGFSMREKHILSYFPPLSASHTGTGPSESFRPCFLEEKEGICWALESSAAVHGNARLPVPGAVGCCGKSLFAAPMALLEQGTAVQVLVMVMALWALEHTQNTESSRGPGRSDSKSRMYIPGKTLT